MGEVGEDAQLVIVKITSARIGSLYIFDDTFFDSFYFLLVLCFGLPVSLFYFFILGVNFICLFDCSGDCLLLFVLVL